MRFNLVGLFVLPALFAALWAAEVWEDKPYTEWSAKEATSVVSDSPWTDLKAITLHDTRQNKPHWVRITWVSDPVRKAYFRLAQLDGHNEPAPPETPQILQFFLQGAVLARFVGPDNPTGIDRGETYLKKKNGDEIPVQAVQFSEDYYSSPLVVLVFPVQVEGQPSVTMEDDEIELVVSLGDRKLVSKFKLENMMVADQLMI